VFDGGSGVFTAPVGGRFWFGLYIGVYKGSGGYYYQIYMRRNGSTVHYIYTSATRDSRSSYDGRYFNTEVDLAKGDTVYFNTNYYSSSLKYSSGSFIEGKIIKIN